MKIPAEEYDRIRAATATITAAVQQLGEGYRALCAARKELFQEAYRVGGQRATQELSFFSDVVLRDRMAAALHKAGLGDVLDVGSGKDHSVSSFTELVDRFSPGAAFETGQSAVDLPPAGAGPRGWAGSSIRKRAEAT